GRSEQRGMGRLAGQRRQGDSGCVLLPDRRGELRRREIGPEDDPAVEQLSDTRAWRGETAAPRRFADLETVMNRPTSRGTFACPRVRLVAPILCAWLVVATPSAHAASKRPPAPPGRTRVEIFSIKGDPNTPDEARSHGKGTSSTFAV